MPADSEFLLRIAEAIADETPVDWNACAVASPDDEAQLEHLKTVESVASAYRSLHGTGPALEDPASSGAHRRPTPETVLFEWGHLKVIEKLGEGSFGEVFQAYDSLLDREVALKLRRPEQRAPASARRRFIQEARRLARVRHPNVITVHGADVHDDRVGLWTDLVAGQTLENWLTREGPLSAEETTLIGRDLCRALAAVHAAGLVHGDVKSTNVMRERGGRIVLMDFGAGAEIEDAHTRRGPAGTLGTPIVMAPELLRGESPSPASDIYSLGVLLYRLVSGRYPVEAATIQELRERHGQGAVAPLRDVRPDLSAEIVAVIGRALAPAPGDRFPSAGAMEHALLSWLAPGSAGLDEAHAAAPAATLPRSGVPARGSIARWLSARSRWQFAAAGALFVAVVATVLAVLLLGDGSDRPALQPSGIRSVAVLPFQALDKEGQNDYLGLGMADALINRLSHLPGIVVRPTSAVLRYAEARPDLQDVGRSLGVEALLDGRIQRSADRVRVTAQLVSTVDGAPIWTATFDRKAANIFELEDSISEQLTRALRIRLTATEKATLAWRPTTKAEAYQAYLKGRYFWNKWTPASVRKSVDFLQQAVQSDPSFALAHVGLADSFTVLAGLEPSPAAPAEAYAQAQRAALQALDLDANLADAHAALGAVRLHHDWDWSAAEAELAKATELNPGCLTAHIWYAELLGQLGQHEEAVAEIRRALETDPLSLPANAIAGGIYLEAGRRDEAVQQLGKALEIEPAFHLAYTFLASAYERQGKNDDVVSNWQNAMVLSGSSQDDAAALGRAYASGGIKAAWRWRLERLQGSAAHEYVPPALIARAHAALGDAPSALAWLDRAVAAHDEFLLRVKGEPAFDFMRSDKRFVLILQRLGLPEPGFQKTPQGFGWSPESQPARALNAEVALYRTCAFPSSRGSHPPLSHPSSLRVFFTFGGWR